MTVQMIDVSSNNHPNGELIDWVKVKAHDVAAVMIKATEGTAYVNPWLDRDSAGAHAAGLQVGYYHFCHPGLNNVPGEANNFWQHTKTLPRSLGLAIDLETTEAKFNRRASSNTPYAITPMVSAGLGAYAQDFLGRIPTEVKQKVLYCDLDFFYQMPGAPWGNDLWLADYTSTMPSVGVSLWAWQRSGSGLVQGVPGNVDLSFLYAV